MKTRTITHRTAKYIATMLINTGFVVIMLLASLPNASAQLFRISGDTTIFSHGMMWGSSLSSYWGYKYIMKSFSAIVWKYGLKMADS